VALEVEALPQAVRLDPDLRLWRLLEAEELPPILRQWTIARGPGLVVVSDGAAREAAEELAARLFESPARRLAIEALHEAKAPVLLVGLHAHIDNTLSRLGLPPRPAVVSGKGSAQVWTIVAAQTAAPLAVVSAQDANALRALLRPLPHYGSQSFLAFDGARVIERGVWPPAVRSVAVEP
jgi:hypothetical protein